MKSNVLFILLVIGNILFSCSSEPAFKDKINEDAYKRIEIGSTYEQALFQVGGMEPRKLTDNILKWENDLKNPTYVISISLEDQKVVSKIGYELVDGEKKNEQKES